MKYTHLWYDSGEAALWLRQLKIQHCPKDTLELGPVQGKHGSHHAQIRRNPLHRLVLCIKLERRLRQEPVARSQGESEDEAYCALFGKITSVRASCSSRSNIMGLLESISSGSYSDKNASTSKSTPSNSPKESVKSFVAVRHWHCVSNNSD